MPEPIFERFPVDGKLYRVVSAGKISAPNPSLATARIQLQFIQIDESDPAHLKWACRPSGKWHLLSMEEAAGSAPKLTIGSFWRDRTLQTEYSMPNDVKIENSVLSPQTWKIVRADDRMGNGDYRISPKEYPVSGEDAQFSERRFGDAPLVQCFTDTGTELLIPCYEVFRRFYCFTSELANTMVAGFWMRELETLIDIEQTRISDDGQSFEVFPLVGIRDIGCQAIALFMTKPVSKRRASEIYLAIDQARRCGVSEPWIQAVPPWNNETVPLNFVGHQLRSGAILVSWIYRSPFPRLDYDVIRIDLTLQIPVASTDGPPMPGRLPSGNQEENSTGTIQPAADTRPFRSALHFGIEDTWDNLARIKRVARKKIFVPFNPETTEKPPEPRKKRLSTGRRSKTGRIPPASLSSDSQNAILNRFKALAECFDQLLKDGEIMSREDYALVDPVQIAGHDYCTFPEIVAQLTRSWSIVDPGQPRPRLCWVSEIATAKDVFYYWVEIEAFSREAFKALVVKPKIPGGRLSVETLTAILKIATIDKGQWKKASLGTVEEQVSCLR